MGRKERGDQNKVLFRAAGASLARSLSAALECRLAAKVSLGKCQVLQKREESSEPREKREGGREGGRERCPTATAASSSSLSNAYICTCAFPSCLQGIPSILVPFS